MSNITNIQSVAPSYENQWACIVIKRQTHTLRHFKSCKTRLEAREEAKIWKDINKHIIRSHRVYIGRTNGF